MRWIRNCKLSKPFSLLVELVLLRNENIVESFLVMLHHRETVNPTKKQLNEAGNMGR
jgi:hypothetical protein